MLSEFSPWMMLTGCLLGLGCVVAAFLPKREFKRRLAGLVTQMKETLLEHDHAFQRLEGRVSDLAGRLGQSSNERRELTRANQALLAVVELRAADMRTHQPHVQVAERPELPRVQEPSPELASRLQEQTAELERNARAIASLQAELGARSERFAAQEREWKAAELAGKKETHELREAVKRQHESHQAILHRASELETSLAHRNRELEEARREVEAGRRTKRDLEAQERSATARVRELEELVSARDGQLREHVGRIESLRREAAERGSQLEDATRIRRELEERLAQKDEDGSRVRRELEERLAQKDQELADLRHQGRERESELTVRVQELEGRGAALDEQLADRATTIDGLRHESAERNRQVDEARERARDLEDQVARRTREVDELRRQAHEVEIAMTVRVRELEGLAAGRDEQLRERAVALESLRGEVAERTLRESDAQRRVLELEEQLRQGALREEEQLRQSALREDEQVRRGALRESELSMRCQETDRAAEELRRSLSEREDEVRERSTAMEELQGDLLRGSLERETLAERCDALSRDLERAQEAAKERERHVQEAEIRTSGRLEELQARLDARNLELERLRESSEQSSVLMASRCTELSARVEDREHDVATRDQRLADLEQRREALELEIQQSRRESEADHAEIDRLIEGRILSLFKRKGSEGSGWLPPAYLDGLARGDLDLAVQGLFGGEEPLSASSMARLTQRWRADYDAWNHLPIESTVVYLWADAVFLKAGLEEHQALLVMVAAFVDGSKSVVAVEAGDPASKDDWLRILREVSERGMNVPSLVVAKNALGLTAAIEEAGWASAVQHCWDERTDEVLGTLPKARQARARKMLRAIASAPNRIAAKARRDEFVKRCGRRDAQAGEKMIERWRRMTSFYSFPEEHWPHLRTTNAVESMFTAIRLWVGTPKNALPSMNTEPIVWKLMSVAERAFRKINAPDLLAGVVPEDAPAEAPADEPRADQAA